MKLGVLISFIIILLFSCQSETYSKKAPDDLISRDTMIMVLKELSLIESHIQDKYLHVRVFKEVMIRSGEHILKKYDLSTERFEVTMDYYGTRQERLKEMYVQVLDSLNKEASKLPQDAFRSSDTSNLIFLPGFPGRP
jgi:hypothetical protein